MNTSPALNVPMDDNSFSSRFDVLKDYESFVPTSKIAITSKSHPELFERLNAQLRIQLLQKRSSSLLSNSKNRAKRARKKSKK